MSFGKVEVLVPGGIMWSFQKFQSPIREKNQCWSFQEGGNSRELQAQEWQDGIKGTKQWLLARKMMFHCHFRIWAAWLLSSHFTPLGFHPSIANPSFEGYTIDAEVIFFFWDLNVNTKHCYKKWVFTSKTYNLKALQILRIWTFCLELWC